ncbi:50S ribosomal protein L17 [bacterium]|nr:50S ribosomal protein L17 [bacterium]MBT3581148.1 50S ribosomal protein L17 [bacterium]MBT4551581.1 50S ribosomal protein L17 [bacterium]MBT5989165.1 50S ribosomal protein L17 [bacterium]MBT7088495.1 50S ribosomal protein L17 [bacterium]
MGYKKLSRPTDQRMALLKSLVRALFIYKKISTTDVRAKEARRMAEKLITLGKKGDLSARRAALRVVTDKKVVKDLFGNIVKKYENRKGGFTRITKVGFRRGDAAKLSVLELLD